MPALAYTFVEGDVGVEGKLVWLRPTADRRGIDPVEFKDIRLPEGTRAVNRRPSWATYNLLGKSRMYGVGAFTANVVIDEHYRLMRQGIPAPHQVPTLVAGTGDVTGIMIGHLRFRDSRGGRVGPLSNPSRSISLTNQGRVWGNIPTTCLDPSVDEVEGLVSVSGNLPRVAWTRQLGPTTVTESVHTLALGEAIPDGDFTEMPYATMNVIYHDRQAVAGLESAQEALFISALGFPERYEGVSFTCDGKVNALLIAGGGDTLFASTINGGKGAGSIWRLQGYTEGDFTWEMDRPDMGIISHHAPAHVHKHPVIPTTDGVYLWVSGTWINILADRRTEWLREFKTYRTDYENAQGFFDPVSNVYTFGPVRHTRLRSLTSGDAWTYWVLDCSKLFSESGGDYGAAWSNDVRVRQDTGRTAFYLPGTTVPEIVTGSRDGFMRLENQQDNDDDDGDSYGKRAIIEPANYRKDYGGDPLDGTVFQALWSYMESEEQDWRLEVRAGGVHARKRFDPDFADVTAGSGLVRGEQQSEARDLHHHPIDLTGDVLSYAIIVDNAKNFRFSGFGGYAQEGGVGGIGGAWARAADGSGVGPGQNGDGLSDPGGAAGPGEGDPLRDDCGVPLIEEYVWDEAVPWQMCNVISDDSLPYLYMIQIATSNYGNKKLRVVRFDPPPGTYTAFAFGYMPVAGYTLRGGGGGVMTDYGPGTVLGVLDTIPYSFDQPYTTNIYVRALHAASGHIWFGLLDAHFGVTLPLYMLEFDSDTASFNHVSSLNIHPSSDIVDLAFLSTTIIVSQTHVFDYLTGAPLSALPVALTVTRGTVAQPLWIAEGYAWAFLQAPSNPAPVGTQHLIRIAADGSWTTYPLVPGGNITGIAGTDGEFVYIYDAQFSGNKLYKLKFSDRSYTLIEGAPKPSFWRPLEGVFYEPYGSWGSMGKTPISTPSGPFELVFPLAYQESAHGVQFVPF